MTIAGFIGRRPVVLTVPGLNGSGPAHWLLRMSGST